MTSKTRILLTLMLLIACPTLAAAQVGGEGDDERGEHEESTTSTWLRRCMERTASYVRGVPWTFDGQLSTTRRELLLGGGVRGVLDQYLSPTPHTGQDLLLAVAHDRPPLAHRWHLRDELELALARTRNRANGTTMYITRLYGMIAPSYTLLERGSLRLEAAPSWSLTLQGDIKLSNTNNVANVKATTGLDAWSRLSYRTPWQTLPVRISYSIALPLLHLTYHPDYGQSYYEYISGDNGAPIHLYLTSLHTSAALRQRLLVELPIHSLTCLIGLQHESMVERISHTEYRSGGVALLVGVSLRTVTLSGGEALRSRQLTASY